MKMRRPVVQDDENPFGIGISRFDCPVEAQQGCHLETGTLPAKCGSIECVQTARNSTVSVGTIAARYPCLMMSLSGICPCQTGTTIVSEFIHIQNHHLTRLLLCLMERCLDIAQLQIVIGVGGMQRLPSAFVAQVPAA